MLGAAHFRSHGKLGVTEPRATRNHHFAHARFGARENVILPGARGLLEHDEIIFFASVFVHHDGVRAARHGRSGKYPHAFAGAHGAIKGHSGAAFADEAQLRARLGCVGGAHCKTIANRTIEWRIVAVGDDVFGENAAERSGRRDAEIESLRVQERRPHAESISITLARAASKEIIAGYSHAASFVPRGTMVASRSGPVEIIPISTWSSSEMKFR